MANRDGSNDKRLLAGLNPTAISSNTTTNGNIIDTRGYDAVTFEIFATAYTDGTFTPLVRAGNAADGSDFADVSDVELTRVESAAALTAARTNAVPGRLIGYVGGFRYVRCNIVSTSVTSGATVGVNAILENPANAPIA